MTLQKPLKTCWITQPFGVNWVDFYTKLGMSGHNGIDLKAPCGTEVYAAHDGFVWAVENRDGYGKFVKLRTKDAVWATIYGHLREAKVVNSQWVQAGDLIGPADNTGKYTTGDHLHFGLRPVNYDKDNGYFGWVDPLPYMVKGWDNLPVDERYGKPKNWIAEWTIRFKNPWVHRRLKKIYKRNPLSLTSQEVNAIIYGGWGFDEVMNESLISTWRMMTKVEAKI